MQARSRALLAALAIPVWGGRGQPTRRETVHLWRAPLATDQQSDPLPELQNQCDTQQGQVAAPHSDLSAIATRTAVNDSPALVVSAPLARMARSETMTVIPEPRAVEPSQAATAVATPSLQPLLRFSVQARVIGAWIVLVPEQSLQVPACQRLWDNIAQALSASPVQTFVWPLAEGARWQRMDGVSAAFAGFLYRLDPQRRVGLMGELPDQVCPDRIERLPSLEGLLAEPLHKRSVWALLRTG
ncbi:MAG: hypothetical protein VXW65_03110 [Pseudomonadota bacterium]|nr:hypothetical protein [Pseudomonadota bacterium]